MWYLSLLETTAALNSSLYQSQCVFVYFFSVILIGEKLEARKMVTLIISLTGVVLISFGGVTEDSNKKSSVKGIMLCIGSVLCFSAFEVACKVLEHRFYDPLFIARDSLYYLGYCGLWMLFFGPILLTIAHFTGYEHFDIPPKKDIHMILNVCMLDTAFNAALVLGVAYASPYIISVGVLAVVPGCFIADYLFGKMTTAPGMLQIGGTLLVVAGFLMLKMCGSSNHNPDPLIRDPTLTPGARQPHMTPQRM